MISVRKLAPADDGWRTEITEIPDPRAGSTAIKVESTLLPPASDGCGIWTGYDPGDPGTQCIGWGPAQNFLSVDQQDLITLPRSDGNATAAGLLIPAHALSISLDAFTTGSRIGVIGEGLLADVAAAVAASRGFSAGPVLADAGQDLLIDASGDPNVWAGDLPAIRSTGTILLLVPPWSKPSGIDFYPGIHRRSLQLIAVPWHRPPSPMDPKLVRELLPVLATVVQGSRWLRQINLGSRDDSSDVWSWTDWTESGFYE